MFNVKRIGIIFAVSAIALITAAVTGCKKEDILPVTQKKITVSGMDAYNGRTASLDLYIGTDKKASGTALIGGGRARFELTDTAGKPFTDNGAYSLTLTIKPGTAQITDLIPWVGAKPAQAVVTETTALKLSEFTSTPNP